MSMVVRPYIPDAAFEWLKEWIKPDMKVFEYGSGASTLWFGKNTDYVVSVEDNPVYFQMMSQKLSKFGLKNITYTLRDGSAYCKYIHEFETQFDLVFVDGRFRKQCLQECFDRAKYAILLDNSDAEHYQGAYEVMKSFTEGTLIDFHSFGIYPETGELLKAPKPNEGEPLAWTASLFLKDI